MPKTPKQNESTTPEPHEPEDGQEPEEDEGRLREIDEASPVKGTSGRWGVAEPSRVQRLSYTPPETVRTTVEHIRAGDLSVDPRYNREIKPKWVEEIATYFNPDQLQVLNVSRRIYRREYGDGEEVQVFDGDLDHKDNTKVVEVVISGQHRLLATLKARGPDFVLTCSVYDGLTPQQEAELFAAFDEATKPHQAYQRHRSHSFGDNPVAVEINRIAANNGLIVYQGVGGTLKEGYVYAVSTVYGIYRNLGPEVLDRVFRIHWGAWQGNRFGYTHSLLGATAMLLVRFGKYAMWRDSHLVAALSTQQHNPQSLSQQARGRTLGVSSTSLRSEIARLEHKWYQEGLHGYARLPEWGATDEQIIEASEAAMLRYKRRKPTDGE